LYYDPKTKVSFGGKTRIITVELVKTRPIVDKSVKRMNNAETWAVFFEYLTDVQRRGKIKEIVSQEEGIAMAVATMEGFTKSEREYLRNMAKLRRELDYQSDMAWAKERATKKGRREGRKIATLENAKKMKAIGISAKKIQAVTGLPIKTISTL